MTLAEFLLACTANDEAVAREVAAERVRLGEVTGYLLEGGDQSFWPDFDNVPSVSVGPDRALAECEAKREIIRLQRECAREGYDNAAAYLEDALRALATVYVDHPDYDEAWRA